MYFYVLLKNSLHLNIALYVCFLVGSRYSEKAAEDVLKGLRKGHSSARGLAEAIKLADAFATFGDGPWRRSWGCAAPSSSSELELEGAASAGLPDSGAAAGTPGRRSAPAASPPAPGPSSSAAANSANGWFEDQWGVWSESTTHFPISGPAGFNFEGFLAQSAQPPKRPPPPPLPKLPPPPKPPPREQQKALASNIAKTPGSAATSAAAPSAGAGSAAHVSAGKITAPAAPRATEPPAAPSAAPPHAAAPAGHSRKKKAYPLPSPPAPTSSISANGGSVAAKVTTAAAGKSIATCGAHNAASAKAEAVSTVPAKLSIPGSVKGEEPSWYLPLQEMALEQAKGMGALRATLLSTLKLLADGSSSSSDNGAVTAAVARELRGCLSDLEQVTREMDIYVLGAFWEQI